MSKASPRKDGQDGKQQHSKSDKPEDDNKEADGEAAGPGAEVGGDDDDEGGRAFLPMGSLICAHSPGRFRNSRAVLKTFHISPWVTCAAVRSLGKRTGCGVQRGLLLVCRASSSNL